MRTPEERLLNPRPGSKIAEAVKYGLDLTLVVENLRRTPQERLENLQASMIGLEKLRQEAARSRKRAK
ncbi:MAG TPA: hypothetical protein PKM58_03135 [Pyrinomonadaceae bacterium]|nr:hypothetical protein [Pyrinomonadaceae bacterium]HNU09317.1 hypothetical protein [Pyrinomonadaceae bacterium]